MLGLLSNPRVLIIGRITLPVLLTVLVFAVAIYTVAIPTQRDSLMQSRKEMVREMTRMAWTLLEQYDNRVQAGEMSHEEAQHRVATRLRYMRYGSESKDYFWINDTIPRMVMHPYRRDLEGHNINNFKDPMGTPLFRNMVEALRHQSDAFVSYHWQWKDDSTRIVPKISNVRRFEPWGWIVGTGMYTDDVEVRIAHMVNKTFLLLSIMLILVLGLSAFIIRHSIKIEQERETAKRALMKSEAEHREFLEQANSLILRISSNGAISYANPQACRFFEYKLNELLDHDFLSTLFDDDYEKYPTWEDLAQVLDSVEGQVFLNRIKSGNKVWVEWFARIVRDSHSKDVDVIMVGNDVTERVHSENALHKVKAHLQNIIDSMPSALIALDSDLRCVEWNQEAQRLAGFKTIGGRGVALEEVFPALGSHGDLVRRAVEEQQPDIIQRKELNFEDGKRWVNIVIYPLIANGSDGVVIRIDDISEQVRLEELMLHTEKMVSVGGLAAGMAHEINNPLSGILQNVQMIEQRFKPDLLPNQKAAEAVGVEIEKLIEYMEVRNIPHMIAWIRECGDRAARIVENMLTFSRKSDLAFEPHDITALLERALELAANDFSMAEPYDFKQIEIVRSYEVGLPHVFVESGLIMQVFLNLMLNSAQAMAEARVSEPSLGLVVQKNQSAVRVSIEDNGPGMDAQTAQRIFEPFFTTKRVGLGTGLGLSVSYFIITQHHGGKMSVESEPGRGCRMIMELPLKKE